MFNHRTSLRNCSAARHPGVGLGTQRFCIDGVGRSRCSTSGHAASDWTTRSRTSGSRCGGRRFVRRCVRTWFEFLVFTCTKLVNTLKHVQKGNLSYEYVLTLYEYVQSIKDLPSRQRL